MTQLGRAQDERRALLARAARFTRCGFAPRVFGLRHSGRRRLRLDWSLASRIRGAGPVLGSVCHGGRLRRGHAERLDTRERHRRLGGRSARALDTRGAPASGGLALRECLARGGPVAGRKPLVRRLGSERGLPADRAIALVVGAVRSAGTPVTGDRRMHGEQARRAGERHRHQRRRELRDGRRACLGQHARRVYGSILEDSTLIRHARQAPCRCR